MGQPLESAARAVRVALDDAARGLVDRELLVDLVALAEARAAIVAVLAEERARTS